MANRVRGPRKEKEWTSLLAASIALTADSTFIASTLAFTSKATVVRMMGEYTLSLINAPVATETARLTVAIGVMSTDAAAVGASAAPDPSDEPEYPWLYWKEHAFHYASTSVDPSQAAGSLRQSFDVRSMRKLSARESLVYIVQFNQDSGTVDMRFVSGRTRVLLALS